MKVSDEDLESVRNDLSIGVREYQKVNAVVVELMVLRKVADAASKLVDEINTADLIDDIPDSVEYADVLEALAKAGR